MPPPRVLIVEDEPNIVVSLRFILERAGFDVATVDDGEQALRLLRDGAFAAVILDVMLPGMNGLDVLKAVRRDERLSRLPVMVLTAKGQAQTRMAAESVGASVFVTKPFSNAEVVRQLRLLVGA